MDKEAIFQQFSTQLFAIAYRMVGSVAEAEDLVQDAFIQWRQSDAEKVRCPQAFLTTIVTRLSIDSLRRAKRNREQYLGPWLPEPLVTTDNNCPEQFSELADSLSMAFMVLLENLNPLERAVYLLREIFGYDYSEIAKIVSKEQANCRQILARARKNLLLRHHKFSTSKADCSRITLQFMDSCDKGDMDSLLELLAEDVVLWSDGGGKVKSALNPIYGRNKVGRFFRGILNKLPPGFTVQIEEINERPGIIGFSNGMVVNVTSFVITANKIKQIYIVNNPDKLFHIRSHHQKIEQL